MTYSVFSFGTYYLIVTDANGCEFVTNSIAYTPTGMHEANNVLDIQIYPNPFQDVTTIDFGMLVKKAEIKLFDVLGKLVEEYELADIDKFILDREDKVNGVYFVEIAINSNKKTISKLVIE